MQQLMAGDIAGAGGHSSDISDSTDEKGQRLASFYQGVEYGEASIYFSEHNGVCMKLNVLLACL